MEYVGPMYTLTDNMRDLIPRKKKDILCRGKIYHLDTELWYIAVLMCTVYILLRVTNGLCK